MGLNASDGIPTGRGRVARIACLDLMDSSASGSWCSELATTLISRSLRSETIIFGVVGVSRAEAGGEPTLEKLLYVASRRKRSASWRVDWTSLSGVLAQVIESCSSRRKFSEVERHDHYTWEKASVASYLGGSSSELDSCSFRVLF